MDAIGKSVYSEEIKGLETFFRLIVWEKIDYPQK